MILTKIYRELVGIREELQGIRKSMEPKTMNVDLVMDEMAKKLERAFSAMPDYKERSEKCGQKDR